MGTETKIEAEKPHKSKTDDAPLSDGEHSPPSAASVDAMIESANLNIAASFLWLASASQGQLETLGKQLAKKDEPPFIERLAMGALEAALLAGPAGAGEYLAAEFLGEVEGPLREGGRELVKAFFEEGIGAGLEWGREKMHAHQSSDPLERFIDSQKEGVDATQHENQRQWNTKGRLQLRTLDEANALERACSDANTRLAAAKQYEASRDAWVSYLAQAKYGEVERGGTTGTGDVHPTKITTYMATQEQRDRTNASAPGFVPAHAPDLTDAIYGRGQGVLTVIAELPEIDGRSMNGTPEIKMSLLNGVNEEVRSQYEWKPIGDLHIPRQIHARVKGEAPNFTINLDEAGNVMGLQKAQSAWLRDRALVGHPENSTMGGLERQGVGISLLLQELVVGDIKKGI